MRNPAQCAQALPSSSHLARCGRHKAFLARGKLQMPVLAFGGEATFGPMIGAVVRCVADNVEDAIIPDCGHWITEEQAAGGRQIWSSTFLPRRSWLASVT